MPPDRYGMVDRVLRRLGSGTTHVARFPADLLVTGTIFGVDYVGPTAPIVTRCGVTLRDNRPLVCMAPGSRVWCRACAHMDGIRVAPPDNADLPA